LRILPNSSQRGLMMARLRAIHDTTWDGEAQVSWRGNGFAYGRVGS
jgi:hypothetical protein